MRTTKHLTLILFVLPLLFACDREARQEAITPHDGITLTKKRPEPRPLPFRATFFTDLDVEALQAGEQTCPGPEFVLPNIQSGEGNALHLGKFTTTLKFCAALVTDPTPEEAAAGLFIRYGELEGDFRAANGDLLHIGLSGVGEIYFTDEPGYDLEFNDVFTIESGTGRFEGASGMMTSHSLVNLTTQRTDHVWTGYITMAK